MPDTSTSTPAEKTTRVKFTQDHLYENEGRNKGHQFKEGETYDLRDDLAQSFISAGYAVATDKKDTFKPVSKPRKSDADTADDASSDPKAVGDGTPAAATDKGAATAKAAPAPAAKAAPDALTTADVKPAGAKPSDSAATAKR